MKGLGDSFTQIVSRVKPHLDLLRLAHKNAHLAMYETIVADCFGREGAWSVTTRTLIARLVRDTGRQRAPNLRRTQQVIRDLERWGLVRRLCADSGQRVDSLPAKRAAFARRNPRGMRYEVAGLDFAVPPLAAFQNWVAGNGTAASAGAIIPTSPAELPRLGEVRASEARSKEDEFLNDPPPTPSLKKNGASRVDSQDTRSSGFRNDPRLRKLLEAVNRLHADRNCKPVALRDVVKGLSSAAATNPDVTDMMQTFADIFTRFASDVPTHLGSRPVQSPLWYTASRRDLQNFQRGRAPVFREPPPMAMRLSAEEIRRREEDTKRLFAVLDGTG